jgi:hypothetical protein
MPVPFFASDGLREPLAQANTSKSNTSSANVLRSSPAQSNRGMRSFCGSSTVAGEVSKDS